MGRSGGGWPGDGPGPGRRGLLRDYATGVRQNTVPDRAQRSAGEVSPGPSTALSRPAASAPMTASHSADPGSTRCTAAVQVTKAPPDCLLGTVTRTRLAAPSPGAGCSP